MTNRTLLLVAGPSGGGKSHFINLLKAKALPRDIAELLPGGCAEWSVCEANNMMKEALSETDLLGASIARGGTILHYDITFIHRLALTDYIMDPFCAGLLDAREIDIVYVKPDKNRLVRQLNQRREAHRRSKSITHLLWADWIRLPLKRARQRQKGLPIHEAHELYEKPDFLNDCYASWEVYLKQLTATIPSCRISIVAPAAGLDDGPSFVLHGPF